MALDFDGINDEVDHGNIASIDATAVLTVMCWANYDTLGFDKAMVAKDTGASEVFAFMSDPIVNTHVIFSNVGSRIGQTGAILATGVWAHYAVAYDGAAVGNDNKVKIYQNGVDQGPLTFNNTPPNNLSGSGGTVETARSRNNSTFADIKLALVKIWLAALTAAEIQQEMNSYRPVRTTNLLLWAPYDDGTSARDYSGNGNHGTVTEAVQTQGPPVSYGA